VWFVDVEMPGSDGLELVRQLRSDGVAKAVVMMLMPSEMEHQVSACQELAVPYIRKPAFRADVIDAALQAIGHRQVVLRKRADDDVDEISPDEPPVQTRVLHVVLAEDNAVNRKFTARMLEHHGHKVTPLPDGKDVLEAVKKGNVDIILMDIEMPEVDGMTATKQVRDWERTNGGHVPIIAMTGRDAADDRTLCIEAGMDEHLTKPVSPDDLFETIARRVPGFRK
jgi:CheY-like chemotaxis protein